MDSHLFPDKDYRHHTPNLKYIIANRYKLLLRLPWEELPVGAPFYIHFRLLFLRVTKHGVMYIYSGGFVYLYNEKKEYAFGCELKSISFLKQLLGFQLIYIYH